MRKSKSKVIESNHPLYTFNNLVFQAIQFHRTGLSVFRQRARLPERAVRTHARAPTNLSSKSSGSFFFFKLVKKYESGGQGESEKNNFCEKNFSFGFRWTLCDKHFAK